ncbi:SwmB domain-containing protein [Chromatium okenii]|uniref:SwmB domain-containing protein n=1 Tax=Chromatium okenii TaxID=61644 RepID=UPI0026EDA70F|nr:SwmB domain-containing protein [Chromatium okenii]MBV5310679.1 hypothetical protein [Chromatium okenii]
MAFTSGNDFNILQNTDLDNVDAGAGDDVYIVTAATLEDGKSIQIVDHQGNNTLQLVGGLEIESSIVAANTLALTLTNGSVITLTNASSFGFEPGGNITAGIDNEDVDYTTFATTTLGVEALPEEGITEGGAVTIEGGGVTDNLPPVVTEETFMIATDASEVGTVTATDPEETTVTYAIAEDGSNPDVDGKNGAAFAIDSETGALTVNDSNDLFADETITLTIEATDADGIIGTGTITIDVTEPENQAPVVTEETFTIATDASEVGTVTATDPEETTVTYAIAEDGSNPDVDGKNGAAFAIDSETGALTVNDSNDLFADETITLTIEATDADGIIGTGTITIDVTEPENQAPVVTEETFTIATDASEVGTVTATDPEETTVTYAIAEDGSNPDVDGKNGAAFAIDSETGALTVNDSNDLFADETITLTIEATDADGIIGTGTITIDVTEPENQAPVVTEETFTIATDASEVGTVTATDPEETTVTYAIAEDGSNPDVDGKNGAAFAIDSETGALTVNDSNDLFADETITLTIEATDADGIIGTGTITIDVTEPENQAPVVTEETFTIATDASEVGTVTATDPEETTVTYAIAEDGSNPDVDGKNGAAFAIDSETGALTVNDSNDLFADETITLTIEATDADGIIGTGTITIAVTEPENQAPTLIEDSSGINGSVLTLTFNESLDTLNVPTADMFIVTVSDEPVAVSDVAIDGAIATLTLETAVTEEQEVTVTYTDSTPDDDNVALQDQSGADVETFKDQPVKNNTGATETVPVTVGNIAPGDNASLVDKTYEFTAGNYDYTIDGFGTGDVLDFPDGAEVSVTNTDFDDGLLDLQWGFAGNTMNIHLTGLTTPEPFILVDVDGFNTLFNNGSLI